MPKSKIAVTIDPELLDWIDERVMERVYASRSHAIQRCVYESRERAGGLGD